MLVDFIHPQVTVAAFLWLLLHKREIAVEIIVPCSLKGALLKTLVRMNVPCRVKVIHQMLLRIFEQLLACGTIMLDDLLNG